MPNDTPYATEGSTISNQCQKGQAKVQERVQVAATGLLLAQALPLQSQAVHFDEVTSSCADTEDMVAQVADTSTGDQAWQSRQEQMLQLQTMGSSQTQLVCFHESL